MILFIAIDGVICTAEHNHCYERAHPIPEAIAKVNALHDGGNTVVLWTSRFTVTGLPSIIDFTRKQLATWGVRYTAIEFSKPEYDAFVDERATTLDALVKGEETPNIIQGPPEAMKALKRWYDKEGHKMVKGEA